MQLAVPLMNRCAASWFELNVSAPDNNVSACCFYAGTKDPWSDQPKLLDEYWNSSAMRAVRQLQSDPAPPAGHGCSACHLYQNLAPGYDLYDFSPLDPPGGLSVVQQENWRLAKSEYLSGAAWARSRPMRVYVNFGFACNIACTMCHQVPRRSQNRRQVLAESVLAWREDLEKAMEVIVIGGEPFVLPEAISFIRKFIKQPQFDSVQLAIATNGTVVHKHWETLREKRKLRFAISLDGVGSAFERVRIGAKWSVVERNLLRILEAKSSDRPDWILGTSANIHKSTLRDLPEFARWHVRHGIGTYFYDFISAAGVEDTYHRENFLQNPHILSDMPEWRDYFDEAISIYAKVGRDAERDGLLHYKKRVDEALAASSQAVDAARRVRMRNDWSSARSPADHAVNWVDSLEQHPAAGMGPIPLESRDYGLVISETRLGDYLSTPLIGTNPPSGGGHFRVRLNWRSASPDDQDDRLVHAVVQCHDGSELPVFREYLNFGFGPEHVLSGALTTDVQAIRIVLTPVGEGDSRIPQSLNIDLDPSTVTGTWPPPSEQPTRRAKLSATFRMLLGR